MRMRQTTCIDVFYPPLNSNLPPVSKSKLKGPRVQNDLANSLSNEKP